MKKCKKITAVILSFAMVLSGAAGINVAKTEVKASVPSTLPALSGLYVADYFDWENDKVKTNTDTSGNTILVNWEGEQIRYLEQDNPEYLTTGVSEGWGIGIDNKDEKWFDYIADGKVTHVNPSDLVITHLDGTPCDDITVTANEKDPRVAVFHAKALEKVKITYKGAELNNVMIGAFALRTGFYASETMSLDAQITGDVNVVNGDSKDFYLHLTDDWEDAGFRLEAENALTVRYWDEESGDVELSGAEAQDYVTVTPVSEDDAHHLVYKVTVQGKNTSEGGYDLKFCFKKHDQNNPSDEWDEERSVYIRVVETNTLYAASLDDLTAKGNRYVYPKYAYFDNHIYYEAGSPATPVYMLFKITDEDGNFSVVTDLSKLTSYRWDYDEEEDKDTFTKVDADELKIEKAYADSDIVKISYPGEPVDFGKEYVITYDGALPDVPMTISVDFAPARFNDIGTYRSAAVNDSNYANEIKTDGTEDLDIYAASVDMKDKITWNAVQTIDLNRVRLIDENGNDLSTKVKTDNNVTLTEETGRSFVYGEKFTIPKGTLSSSATLKLNFTVHAAGEDGQEYTYETCRNVLIFYSEPATMPTETPNGQTPTPAAPTPTAPTPAAPTPAAPASTSDSDTPASVPKKGEKVLANGNTYKITSVGNTNSVTFIKCKNTKSAVVPGTIKIKGTVFTVTGIGANAFKGCNKLKTLTIKSTKLTAETIRANAFKGIGTKTVIKIPKSKKIAYTKLFRKKGLSKKVTIK